MISASLEAITQLGRLRHWEQSPLPSPIVELVKASLIIKIEYKFDNDFQIKGGQFLEQLRCCWWVYCKN